MATTYEESQRRQHAVDVVASRIIDLLLDMAENDAQLANPEKWDEEYAGCALYNCLDRIICAPQSGMPKPSADVLARWNEVFPKVRGFLFSDYPLPGEGERLAREIADLASDDLTAPEHPEQAQEFQDRAERATTRANQLPLEERIAIAEALGAPEGMLTDAHFTWRLGPDKMPLIGVEALMRPRAEMVDVSFTVDTRGAADGA